MRGKQPSQQQPADLVQGHRLQEKLDLAFTMSKSKTARKLQYGNSLRLGREGSTSRRSSQAKRQIAPLGWLLEQWDPTLHAVSQYNCENMLSGFGAVAAALRTQKVGMTNRPRVVTPLPCTDACYEPHNAEDLVLSRAHCQLSLHCVANIVNSQRLHAAPRVFSILAGVRRSFSHTAFAFLAFMRFII